jgi:hypothetical protein
MERERLNVYLPCDVAEDLRRLVPAWERARFVSRVLRAELSRLKLLAAIEASAGAWRDEDHPDLATPADIDRWIQEGRTGLNWDRLPGETENG